MTAIVARRPRDRRRIVGMKAEAGRGNSITCGFLVRQMCGCPAMPIEFEPKWFAERGKSPFGSVCFCSFESDVVDIAG